MNKKSINKQIEERRVKREKKVMGKIIKQWKEYTFIWKVKEKEEKIRMGMIIEKMSRVNQTI